MPVLNVSVGIHSKEDVLGDAGGVQWAPSQIESGHRLFHLGVEDVALLASEYIKDANGAVSAASRNVLVVPVEANRESRDAYVTEHVLGRHFQV